jgi:anti-anti-sigma factor
MLMYQFDVEPHKDARIIRIRKDDGERSPDPFSQVKARIGDLLREGTRRLVLDMADVDFIDSRALGSLVGCYRAVQEAEGLIVLVALSPQVAMIFRMVNFLKLMPIRKTREEGLQSILRVSPRKGTMERLIQGNPSIEDLKAGDPDATAEVISIPKSGPKRTSPAVFEPEPETTTAPPPPAAPGSPSHVPVGEDDWAMALRLYTELTNLTKRHGLEATPEITFSALFSRLAEKLARNRSTSPP